jgi:hypothetical protein
VAHLDPRRDGAHAAPLVRAWRASVLEAGLPRIRRRSDVPLHVVRGEHASYEERDR